MAWLDFPAFLQLAQRQTIRRVAIDFVSRCKNERRLGRKLSRGFEQIQCAVRVHRKIGLRIASCPVVRRLRRSMHDRFDRAAMPFE